MQKLSDHINIGNDTESKLIQVGIDSYEKLQAAGSHEAFTLLQKIDPGACLSLLYGLEGAIAGIKWNKLPPETKKALQQFYRITKKNKPASLR
ncbi:MAG: TfoX/Sxy family protein [Kaistella sp.]|nr:TfoX/Sxy family protein [Kaistella sp.]